MLINLLTTQLLALALFGCTAPRELKARVPERLPHAALKEKIPPGESLLYFAERSNTVTEIDWRRYGKMIGCREFSGPDGNPAFGPD